MKIKHQNILLTVILFFMIFSSCSNFEDINTNPDNTNKAPSSMLCTNILLRITKFGGDAKAYIATNALPKYVGYAQEGQMAEQYNKFGTAGFGYYNAWPNIDDMVRYARNQKFENSYTGVAFFVKAYMLYTMTMQMGDIPCSEAGLGEKGFKPKYDTQEDVFITILNYLGQADVAFSNAASEKFPGDPVYDGDVVKWRKAVNSFTLKVLMSLSGKADVASLDVKKRFSEIIGANNLMTDNTDNFLTRYADEMGKYHPLYNNSKFTTNTMLSSLLVNELKRLNDYRLFYFAEPSPVKIESGIPENNMEAYVGVDVEISYDNINLIFNSKDFSRLNLRYDREKAPEPLAIISYAEQQLIIAEAIELGWLNGSSRTYYETGVKAALDFVGRTDARYSHGMPINQAYIDNYFTNEAAAYASTNENRLKQIWMQRYILHFMQDAATSYFEYRRVSYPVFPINPNTNLNENNRNKIPVRWMYPSGESNTNRDNLKDALDRQYGGNDEVNQIMWLLK